MWLILAYLFQTRKFFILCFFLDIMAKDSVRMPSGMGGLVRYFEDYKSKIEFKPRTVVVFVILVIIIEIILHTRGVNWFG